jgi:hypothetical protein
VKHVVVLKNTDVLLGQVIEKEYSIKTSYANLKFSRNQIVHIHFENPPQLPQDEMLLLTGDTLKGIIVSPRTISLKLESNGQVIKFNKKDLHTIMFLDST